MNIFITLIIISSIFVSNTTEISNSTAQVTTNYITQEVLNNREEILWLARIIYSETKVEEEMILIAWVARNRKDTGYRGDLTYETVAKSRYQFSGLNSFDPEYYTNINLGYKDTSNKSWVMALDIAEKIYYANNTDRPFPQTVRHFYSPKSVVNTPSWADTKQLYYSVPGKSGEPMRFAFYNKVK